MNKLLDDQDWVSFWLELFTTTDGSSAAGEIAANQERDARKAAEARVAELEAQLAKVGTEATRIPEAGPCPVDAAGYRKAADRQRRRDANADDGSTKCPCDCGKWCRGGQCAECHERVAKTLEKEAERG